MKQAFDTIANDYDAFFTNSIIGKAQRNIVWNYLDKSIASKEKLNVLELNCGTGEDALWFGKKGHKVLATDISENMLKIAQKKINDTGLDSLIRIMKLDLSKIDYNKFNEKFDMIFSNFGGMNCISFKDMEKLHSEIKKLLNPNGLLIMVIMPTFCFWETIYFFFKLNLSSAFRRLNKDGVITNFDGSEMKTFYYSPSTIKDIFARDFNFISVKPVGLFIPPSYLEKYFRRNKKKINLLIRLERFVSHWTFLSGFSDHFIIHLQAK